MKIKNIFKKENKTLAKANVEKLEKNQLEKVIGGGGKEVDKLKEEIKKLTNN